MEQRQTEGAVTVTESWNVKERKRERESVQQHISLNKKKLESSDDQLVGGGLINMVTRPQVCRAQRVTIERRGSLSHSLLLSCGHLCRSSCVSRAGLSTGAHMAMAAACRASGLMGKNDRNLQLIMPRSEMFVSR